MIALHYSNWLDRLTEPLAESVDRHQARDPIAPVSIVVPNRAIERFVKYRLAERLGVAANLKFPFLRAFLAQIVEHAEPGIRVLEADHLRMLLFERLRAESRKSNPAFRPIDAYLDSQGSGGAERDLRRFRLADRLAGLMHQYSITRGDMVAGWRRGSRFKKEPWAASERWQRELWRLIFDERRAVRAELVRDAAIRWMLLPAALGAIADDALKRVLPGEIHIFALPNAGPAYVKIFADLARLTSVQVYAINPCLEFWEDLRTVGGIDRARMIHRRDRIADPFADDLDRFCLLEDSENHALKLWGRPGREYIRLLNQLTDCDFDDRFSRRTEGDHSTLLATLQDDILKRVPAAGSHPAADGGRFAGDASVRILACPGIRREVEIVANAIWSVLRSDSGPDPIRFHQIAMLVPDASLASYLPHLESVFDREPRIPIEIAGHPMAQRSRVPEAVDLLLALPLGRFTRDQVVRLLTHPALIADDREVETERWAAWCAEAGVVFGADRDRLRGTYLDGDLYHWDQALRRIALGVFMTGERSGESKPATLDGARYLPLELGQDAGESAMHLLRKARAMIADALALADARMTVADWSRALAAYVSRYVPEGDGESERARSRCLREIAEMAPDDFRCGPVGYEVAREVAAGAIGRGQAGHGQLRGTGVAVGSMDALRSIPFRVIFVMGLGEATFPARERRDPLDLTLGERSAGDVSPSERDRYLFLAAILAARERLFLSYVNRNSQTGESLEPSAVLRELEYILRGYLDEAAVKNLTIEHPVSRYDLRYFRELPHAPADGVHPELASFDSNAMRGARMAALRECAKERAGALPLPGRDDPLIDYFPEVVQSGLRDELCLRTPAAAEAKAEAASGEVAISIAALRRYLECPLQGAARYALGMNDDEGDEDEFAEDEPLARTTLDRTIALREVFERAAEAGEAKRDKIWDDHFEIAEMHGRAPAGVFKDAARESDRAVLNSWCEEARQAGAIALENFVQVRMGAADEFARTEVRLAPLCCEVSVTEPDGTTGRRRVRLHGGLGLMRRARKDAPYDAALLAVARDKTRPADFLRLALSIMALAASGEPLAPQLSALLLTAGGENSPSADAHQVAAPNKDEALGYLKNLVSDLLSAGNDRFLPIEAVEKAREVRMENGSERELAGAVEAIRENHNTRSRSDYGPVREARERFSAPAGDEIARILARRYDPIEWIFDRSRPKRRRGGGGA